MQGFMQEKTAKQSFDQRFVQVKVQRLFVVHWLSGEVRRLPERRTPASCKIVRSLAAEGSRAENAEVVAFAKELVATLPKAEKQIVLGKPDPRYGPTSHICSQTACSLGPRILWTISWQGAL